MTGEPQLNRIERRKIEFRDKITRAALKLFEEQGVSDTSVAAIIKEADIAHKTFFNHFPTKDHLLQHIVSTFSDYAYAVFREAFKQYTDPGKRIEYCLLAIAKALEPLDPHYKELINFYLISGSGAADLRAEQKQKFVAIVNQIVSDAKSRTMLRPGIGIETYSEMIVGICVSVLLNWSVEEEYALIAKMKKAVRFINASVFISDR